MKYLEVVMAILMINLTAGIFAQTNLINMESVVTIQSDSPVDMYGNLLENNSLSYKIYKFNEDRQYLSSAQNLDQQYLQSGGDFIKGLFWFLEAFVKGTILFPLTLKNFGVPSPIIYFFTIPLLFLYIMAIVQLVSGRSFGGNY